jgi:uncharacterized protein (TIGR02996 family)
MNDRAAFLRAIRDRPDDDTIRLVFADWLEENGGAKAAERIRRQIANGKTFKINGLGGFPFDPTGPGGDGFLVTWRRGFVDEIRCRSEWWILHGDAVTARHPVTRVRLTTWPDAARMYELCRAAGMGESPGNRIDRWAGILRATWPGVAFELPPEPMYYSAVEAFEDMRRQEEELRREWEAVGGDAGAAAAILQRLGRPLSVRLDPPVERGPFNRSE